MFAYWWKKPVNLEIQIPMVRDLGSAKEISDAIRNHFRYVLIGHTRDTAIFIRERRTVLAFTVLNILIALLYVGYVYQHAEWMSTIAGTLIGGLIIIINWATIWDTYEFFIFDGREKSQRRKLLTKITDGEIQVIPLVQDR